MGAYIHKFFRSCLLAAMCVAVARAEVFPGWKHQALIVLNGPKHADLLDFPALVRLPPEVTRGMQPGGADMRFADAGGVELAHETDTWNPEGESLVWVKVPMLSDETPLTVYWGNEAPPPPRPAGETWADGFAAVWHFNEPAGVEAVDDATRRKSDGLASGTAASPGMAGGAKYFDGRAHVRVPADRAAVPGGAFTVSAWVKAADQMPYMAEPRLFSNKRGEGAAGWEIFKTAKNQNQLGLRGGGDVFGTVVMPAGATFAGEPRDWVHVAVQFPGTGGNAVVYINGEKAGAAALGTVAADATQDLYLGASASGTDNWRGFMDEVRVENTVRPPEWMRAAYQTVHDAGFTTCGAPQERGGPPAPLATVGVRRVTTDSAEVVGAATDFHAQVEKVRLYWGTLDEGEDTRMWPYAAAVDTSSLSGGFFVKLSGLKPQTKYYARFCAETPDGAPRWSPASISFTTPVWPSPLLGGVKVRSVPVFNTLVQVKIVEPGPMGELTVAWQYAKSDKWIPTPAVPAVAGETVTVVLPDLKQGGLYRYRATLAAATEKTMAEGMFVAAYEQFWTGAAHDGQWRSADNWQYHIVPDAPGEAAVFEYGHSTVEVSGKSVTLGRLEIMPEDRRERRILSTDGSRLVFDNPGGTAEISISGSTQGRAVLEAPLVLAQKTRVRVDTGDAGGFFLEGSVSGRGPLVLEGGRLCFNTPKGAGIRVTVPLQTTAGGTPAPSFQKRGGGDVTLAGGVHSIAFSGARDERLAAIGGGGSLFFSGATVTNVAPGGQGFLFADGHNRFALANGARFTDLHDGGHQYHSSSNAITLSNASATMALLEFDGLGNTLTLTDGASFSSRSGGIRCSGEGALLHVSSRRAGRPSVLDLRGNALELAGSGNNLAVTFGGVVANAAITVGGAGDGGGNRLFVHNGRVDCTRLSVSGGNILALKVQKTAPLRASESVRFLQGAILLPVNTEQLSGRFPLVVSPEITGLEGVSLKAPPGSGWRIEHDPRAKALYLVCP